VQDVDRDLAEAFGLDRPVGALVVKVLPDSPAERGGMLPGDVVLEVNGKALSDANSLPMHVGQIMPGEEVRVTVARDRTFITLKFKLAETPDSARAPLLMDEESQALPARAPSHPSGHAPLPRRG
jgi:serine protease Do